MCSVGFRVLPPLEVFELRPENTRVHDDFECYETEITWNIVKRLPFLPNNGPEYVPRANVFRPTRPARRLSVHTPRSHSCVDTVPFFFSTISSTRTTVSRTDCRREAYVLLLCYFFLFPRSG